MSICFNCLLVLVAWLQKVGCELFRRIEMALHSGLLWLADGFGKHNKLATATVNSNLESGDANCPPALHKLTFSNDNCDGIATYNSKHHRPTSAQAVKTKVSSRPLSAKITRQTNASRPRQANSRSNKSRKGYKVVAPADLTPRTGAWTAEPHKSHQCHPESQVRGAWSSKEFQSYSESLTNGKCHDLPVHPDLRYFDRHSRCYNASHCGDTLSSTRPRTVCSAGRQSLTQCECCGEVTSMIRYRYAPTGSAMTEMNSGNKTFLYPEKLLSYDCYKGRRRPSSAPSHSVSNPICGHLLLFEDWLTGLDLINICIVTYHQHLMCQETRFPAMLLLLKSVIGLFNIIILII